MIRITPTTDKPAECLSCGSTNYAHSRNASAARAMAQVLFDMRVSRPGNNAHVSTYCDECLKNLGMAIERSLRHAATEVK